MNSFYTTAKQDWETNSIKKIKCFTLSRSYRCFYRGRYVSYNVYLCRITLSNGQWYANKIICWQQSLANAYQSVYIGSFTYNFICQSINSSSNTARIAKCHINFSVKGIKYYVLFIINCIILITVLTSTVLCHEDKKIK